MHIYSFNSYSVYQNKPPVFSHHNPQPQPNSDCLHSEILRLTEERKEIEAELRGYKSLLQYAAKKGEVCYQKLQADLKKLYQTRQQLLDKIKELKKKRNKLVTVLVDPLIPPSLPMGLSIVSENGGMGNRKGRKRPASRLALKRPREHRIKVD